MTAKILIIDDESDIRMLVAGFLKDEGYQTIEAKNSTEALSLFSKEMLDEIKINRKVSNKHTYTSCLLSKVAHHNKTSISFDAKYLDKVDNAIKNAKKLETNLDNLLENIGSNFVDLLTLLKTN